MTITSILTIIFLISLVALMYIISMLKIDIQYLKAREASLTRFMLEHLDDHIAELKIMEEINSKE